MNEKRIGDPVIQKIEPLSRLGEPDLPERQSREEIEAMRWVLDAKARALVALCTLQSSGKGDDTNRGFIHDLARQVIALAKDNP
jgi:hypothetical protein